MNVLRGHSGLPHLRRGLTHSRSTGSAPGAHPAAGPAPSHVPGRTWHAARTQALGPAAAATALARRPYDLRHAAQSLWLNAGAAPAQIAQRPGHSITMLLAVYTHCIDGQADITNRQIEHALLARSQAHCVTASGSANRRYHPDPVRHMSVHGPHSRARTADCQLHAAAARTPRYDHRLPFPQLRAHPRGQHGHHERAAGPAGSGPRMAHNTSQRSPEPLVFSVRAADASLRQRLQPGLLCGRCWVRTNVG